MRVLLSFGPFQIISGGRLRLNHFLIPRIPLKCHQMDHRPFLGLPSIKQFCQFAFVKLKSRVRWGPIISRFPNRSRWSCLQFGRHKMSPGFLTSSIGGAAVGYKFWRVRFHVIKAAIAAIWYKKSPWRRQQFHCNFIPSLSSGSRPSVLFAASTVNTTIAGSWRLKRAACCKWEKAASRFHLKQANGPLQSAFLWWKPLQLQMFSRQRAAVWKLSLKSVFRSFSPRSRRLHCFPSQSSDQRILEREPIYNQLEMRWKLNSDRTKLLN